MKPMLPAMRLQAREAGALHRDIHARHGQQRVEVVDSNVRQANTITLSLARPVLDDELHSMAYSQNTHHPHDYSNIEDIQ